MVVSPPRLLPIVLFPVLLTAGGCARKAAFGDLALPTLATSQTVSLKSCPAAKCWTVYVAPWCGYCRAATPLLNALRPFLKARNVATRIIVGQDSAEAVRDYAREFGPDTLLDLRGEVPVSGGVPHTFVSDASGAILKDMAGVPQVDPPWSEEALAEVAGLYGLP